MVDVPSRSMQRTWAGNAWPASTGMYGDRLTPPGRATAGMTEFLGEIGRKLAERWVTLLAVPGLLYLGVVTIAAALGQDHALDFPWWSRQVSAWAGSAALRSTGGALLIAAAVLTASIAAGLAAAVLGRITEIAWTTPGRHRPARWLTNWRRARSQHAKRIADDPTSSAVQVRGAIARANRICLVEADRPTWIGDRLRASQIRIQRAYDLDLAAIWPRLWLIVPNVVRTEIGAARDSFTASARLIGWAVLYLILGIWWWPAIVISVMTGATGVIKGRQTADILADLTESAVDLYNHALAAQVGRTIPGLLTPTTGKELTALIRKSRWDPDSPLAE